MGGLGKYLPQKVKQFGWNTMARIRHAILGNGSSSTSKVNKSKTQGNVAVGEETTAALTEQMINALKKIDRKEAERICKENGWNIEILNKQGATSELRTEVGYIPIANSGAPKKSAETHAKRSNTDILTDTTLNEAERRAQLKRNNNWTDAQVDAFLRKQVTGTPARSHLEIGDAADVIGWGRQNAYDAVASISDKEASDYSKKIFGADFTR